MSLDIISISDISVAPTPTKTTEPQQENKEKINEVPKDVQNEKIISMY